MNIILDTNTLYNNWHLKNVNFQRLFYFAAKNKATFLIPEIVCMELENKYQQIWKDLQNKIQKTIALSNEMLPKDAPWDIPSISYDYSFKENLINETKPFQIKVRFIPFNEIDHQIIVERSMKLIKPFQTNEKGYRDTLIWLSILKYLEINESSSITVFITSNTNDFYNSDKKTLHSELKKDLKDYGIKKFQVFKNLSEFLNHHENKTEIASDKMEMILQKLIASEKEISKVIEDKTNNHSVQDFLKIVNSLHEEFHIIKEINGFEVSILDSLCDFQLLNLSELNTNEISVEFKVTTNKMSFGFEMSINYYESIKQKFDVHKCQKFEKDDRIEIWFTKKTHITLSIIYNSKNDKINQIDVNKLYTKQEPWFFY